MKNVTWDFPNLHWDDPNLYWSDPTSYLLEPGDPGYVADPTSASFPKSTKSKHKYKMGNPTPTSIGDLIAAGEDLCDGLDQHAVAINVMQNTAAVSRANLTALTTTHNNFNGAQGAQPAAHTALRIADSNAKGFIGAAIKVLAVSLGDSWSDAWVATGLPDNSLGIPSTQDKRFTALGGLLAYLTANPGKEVATAAITVTAALATTLHTALSTARGGVANALSNTKAKLLLRDTAEAAFRMRYRGVIAELEQLLSDEDPKWYDFGLNRPADPSTPGVPGDVVAAAIGGGRVLVQVGFSRRANSFNYYKQVTGTDAAPVKVLNTQGTQHTNEGLPVGATVKFTVAGVNDAGEGVPSDPVSVVVT